MSEEQLQHVVDVVLSKPPPWRRRRVLIGVSWEVGTSTMSKAVVAETFADFPATDRLFPRDEIIEVMGNPILTPEDVVFHWEAALAQSEVTLRVRRRPTHLVTLRVRSEAGEAKISWCSDATPRVEELRRIKRLGASSAQGERTCCSGEPNEEEPILAGDLIVAVAGAAVSRPAQMDAVLERCLAGSDQVLEVRLQRGLPAPFTDASSACDDVCCWWWSGRTRVPRAAAASTSAIRLDASPLLEFS